MEQQDQPELVTHMILDARPTPETERALRQQFKVPARVEHMTLCVFEVRLDGFAHYCCWAGGEVPRSGPNEGKPMLTLIGQAAAEALALLPFHRREAGDPLGVMVIQEVRLGATPLREKVVATLRATRGKPVCFVGDLAHELDGLMGPAFNLTGHPLRAAECAGPGPLVLQ